jgi:hypothetical protein
MITLSQPLTWIPVINWLAKRVKKANAAKVNAALTKALKDLAARKVLKAPVVRKAPKALAAKKVLKAPVVRKAPKALAAKKARKVPAAKKPET